MICEQSVRVTRIIWPTILVLILTSCFEEPARYQEGLESSDLKTRLTGVAVIGQGRDAAAPHDPRIITFQFPSTENASLVNSSHAVSVSGPSTNGVIAFIERAWDEERHTMRMSLKACDRTGKVIGTCFTRFGDVYDSFREPLAISFDGLRVAYIETAGKAQMPGALLTTGRVVIWNVDTGQTETTPVTAMDDNLFFLRSNNEILFTALSSRDEIANRFQLPASPLNRSKNAKWVKYPMVFKYNLETKKTELIHPGMHAHLSPDAQSLLVFNGGFWTLVDLAKGTAEELKVPSEYWIEPRALLNDQKCIYVGFPTQGTEIRRIKYGSFSSGSLMTALKVTDLKTWEFQTIVPYFDIRDPMSFGILTSQPDPK